MKFEELKRNILSVKSPAKYLGGEYGAVRKNKSDIDVRFAFCFPDTYEIGMSHLGLRILYGLINSRPNFWCERSFAPEADFENLLNEKGIKLYALESFDPLCDFDFVGFTLQYELSYTNVLNMLSHGGIPVLSDERGENDPIVIGGGPCCANPEPVADFFDLFVLGDGEEVTLEILDLYNNIKQGGSKQVRKDFLETVGAIEGVYVPRAFDEEKIENGNILCNTDNGSGNKLCNSDKIFAKKRVVKNLDRAFFPKDMIVPLNAIVHDRAVEEILRGCIRGCRFCQAGFIYRPYREKTRDTINAQVRSLCDSSGYDEVSLSSLSTSDYGEIETLLEELNNYTESNNIGMSLPSMRIDRFSDKILSELMKVKKSGLTFAPEAGSQRLRDVISKNITEEEIMNGCRIAFSSGMNSVKLYFMIGLPTETDTDIAAIAELAERIAQLYYDTAKADKSVNNGKLPPLRLSISSSTFIPKPFTPFQFCGQASREEIAHKQNLLRELTRNKRYITVSYGDYNVSLLEAVMAKGGRKIGKIIYRAWQNGCKMDGWDEQFHWKIWQQTFEENNFDPIAFTGKTSTLEDILAWDHLDFMVKKSYLYSEYQKALNAETTPSCREKCSNCGIIEALGSCTACKTTA